MAIPAIKAEADRAKAAEYQATLTEEDIEASWRRAGVPRRDVRVVETVRPFSKGDRDFLEKAAKASMSATSKCPGS